MARNRVNTCRESPRTGTGDDCGYAGSCIELDALPCRKKRRKVGGTEAEAGEAAATDDDAADDEPAGAAIAAGIVRQTTRSGEIAVHIHPCCSHHMLDVAPCCRSVCHPDPTLPSSLQPKKAPASAQPPRPGPEAIRLPAVLRRRPGARALAYRSKSRTLNPDILGT